MLEARETGASRTNPLSSRRETTGPPSGIQLKTDRKTIHGDGLDVAIIEAHIVDSSGGLVPTADSEVTFRLIGAGRIIGVGNGDPSSHEPDKAEKRRAFNGLCVAIVQSAKESGEIRIEAISPGLKGTSVVLTSSA